MMSAFELAPEPEDDPLTRAAFFAALAHDLRTPLTVLNGAAELLLRGTAGSLTDDQRALVEAIRRHAQALTGVVNDALAVLE